MKRDHEHEYRVTASGSRYCPACQKRYRESNKDEIKKKSRIRYLNNREKVLSKQKEYRKANPEKTKLSRKADYEKNKYRYKERANDYYAKNKEHCLAVVAEYVKANKEKIADRNKSYRLTESGKESHSRSNTRRRVQIFDAFVEDVDRRIVWERSNGFCFCLEPVKFDKMAIDHIVPLSRGGKHSYENVRASHKSCNSRKHAKLDSELAS